MKFLNYYDNLNEYLFSLTSHNNSFMHYIVAKLWNHGGHWSLLHHKTSSSCLSTRSEMAEWRTLADNILHIIYMMSRLYIQRCEITGSAIHCSTLVLHVLYTNCSMHSTILKSQ